MRQRRLILPAGVAEVPVQIQRKAMGVAGVVSFESTNAAIDKVLVVLTEADWVVDKVILADVGGSSLRVVYSAADDAEGDLVVQHWVGSKTRTVSRGTRNLSMLMRSNNGS